MTKTKKFIFVVAGIILMIGVLSLPFHVGSVQGERLLQTVPSRTPTPQGGPSDPTNTSQPPPPPTDDPGGSPQNTPSSDPGSTPTGGTVSPTSTTAATIELMTPEGGYEATAQPCGTPPTVQARGTVNVREGPGLDYEPIDSLIYLEVRPIIGRAEFATWWLIQLPDDETGWVANQAVFVQGYTGAVPIVDPPELDGATPTPGPLWEPTPNPICTPEPTPTPTNTAEPTEEVSSAAPATVSTTPTEVPPEPTATEEPETASPTDTPSPEPEPTLTTSPPTPTTDTGSPITEEPSPDEVDGPAATTSSWIFIVGIGLVIVGAVSWILRNRQV